MRDSVAITIPSNPRYLSVVRAVSARMAEIGGMTAADVESLRLAVDEACSNVIKYSYQGDLDRRIVVRFRIAKTFFEVVIDDDGVKADAAAMRGRDLADIRPGGLGIHLIHRAFDSVSFDEGKKKGNRLRMRKHRART
jgi:anti-sigma regulatory factor (Ser/Thr protein kinase)